MRRRRNGRYGERLRRQRNTGDHLDLVARNQFGRFLARDICLTAGIAAQEYDLASGDDIAVLLHPDLDGGVGFLTERRRAAGIRAEKPDLERHRLVRLGRKHADNSHKRENSGKLDKRLASFETRCSASLLRMKVISHTTSLSTSC